MKSRLGFSAYPCYAVADLLSFVPLRMNQRALRIGGFFSLRVYRRPPPPSPLLTRCENPEGILCFPRSVQRATHPPSAKAPHQSSLKRNSVFSFPAPLFSRIGEFYLPRLRDLEYKSTAFGTSDFPCLGQAPFFLPRAITERIFLVLML